MNSEKVLLIDCSQPAAIVQPRCPSERGNCSFYDLRFPHAAENHFEKYLLDLFGVGDVVRVIPAI